MKELEQIFFKACKQKDIELINDCIAKGVNINIRNKDDQTALMVACAKSRIEIVKLLLKAGANLDVALFVACNNDKQIDNHEIVKLLLDNGAKSDYEIIWSSKYGHLETAKLLFQAGIDVNVSEQNKNTALIWACHYGHPQHIEIVKLLLNAGANIETKDSCEYTPLILATNYGHAKMVEVLLENNADISFKATGMFCNFQPSTALDIAKYQLENCDEKDRCIEFKEIVELLEDAGKTRRFDNQISQIDNPTFSF